MKIRHMGAYKKIVKSRCATSWMFVVLALVVIFAFIVLDLNMLVPAKDNFSLFESRTPYTQMSAAIPLGGGANERNITAKSREECMEKCTVDDACKAYVYDGVKNNCKLVHNITGFERSDSMFTTSSGIKLRDFIPDKTGKFLRFEEKQLPADNVGRISTHNMVRSVHECKSKCDEISAAPTRCMVFEYDFNTKICTLNQQLQGQLQSQKSADVYVAIN